MRCTTIPQHKSRSGAVAICVMVCLLITSTLSVAVLRQAVTAHREIRIRLQKQQTKFLLEAGTRRAIAKLEENPAYEGEEWTSTDLVEQLESQIIIRVTRSEEETDIEVVAKSGTDISAKNSSNTIQESHIFRVN